MDQSSFKRLAVIQPLDPIPSRMNLLHTVTSYFLKVSFNIIRPHTPSCRQWFPLMFSGHNLYFLFGRNNIYED
jgi:hypothetical protein